MAITFSNSAGPLHAGGICANKIAPNACRTQAQEAIRAHNKALDEQLKRLQQQRDEVLNTVKKRLRDERLAKLNADEKALLGINKEQRANVDVEIAMRKLAFKAARPPRPKPPPPRPPRPPPPPPGP